jgi:hypothetical protein
MSTCWLGGSAPRATSNNRLTFDYDVASEPPAHGRAIGQMVLLSTSDRTVILRIAGAAAFTVAGRALNPGDVWMSQFGLTPPGCR